MLTTTVRDSGWSGELVLKSLAEGAPARPDDGAAGAAPSARRPSPGRLLLTSAGIEGLLELRGEILRLVRTDIEREKATSLCYSHAHQRGVMNYDSVHTAAARARSRTPRTLRTRGNGRGAKRALRHARQLGPHVEVSDGVGVGVGGGGVSLRAAASARRAPAGCSRAESDAKSAVHFKRRPPWIIYRSRRSQSRFRRPPPRPPPLRPRPPPRLLLASSSLSSSSPPRPRLSSSSRGSPTLARRAARRSPSRSSLEGRRPSALLYAARRAPVLRK